ncbi:hemin uptake protein HemP [Chitinimonas sp.]|uniref:hemin uptake protein HemP n=1 Tax=Chitinimonas sp. TaxID=1934313 RepID=UPI002F958CEE
MNMQTSPTPPQAAPANLPAVVEASTLMGKHSEIAIRHRGEIYRLRVTRNGKLILTK